MAEQLIKKDCRTGEYSNISPATTTDAVTDPKTGKVLSDILNDNSNNHIYLTFKDNSRAETRLQVPSNMRRKGLWVTYISCKNEVVTEWYNGDSIDDTAWKDSKNWTPYISKEYIESIVNDIIDWYKI